MPIREISINELDQSPPSSIMGEAREITQAELDTPRTWSQYAAQTAENVPRMALQGLTLGTGDEITAGVGAAAASLMGRGSFQNEYDKQLKFARGQIDEARTQNPVLSPVSEIGGAIAGALPLAGTTAGAAIGGWASRGLLPQAKSLAGRAANLFTKGAVSGAAGAAGGAAYGFGEAEGGQRLEGARQGAILGGAIGAAVPVAGAAIGGAASALAPKVDEGFQGVAELAQSYKIPLSIDQLTSSKPIKTFQKVSQELPLSGVGSFRDVQLGRWNNELLKTIGVEGDKVTPEVMDAAFTKVGKQFDSLGKGKTFTIPQEFKSQIDEIMADAQITAKKDAIENFGKGLQRVYDNVAEDGTISGERLSLLRQELNKLSRKASDPDTQELLKDLEGAVIDIMTAGDDIAKGVLSDAKQKYKNLIIIEPIAQKATGGNISPSLLANRVAKVYGRQYTRGKAGEIGDLARIGKELLPELGGSDTTQKAAYLLGTGVAIGNPVTMVPAAAALITNRAAQKLFNQNQKLVDRIINKGKLKSDAALPKGKTPPTLPAAKAAPSVPTQYVTLPDGTVIPRVTIPRKQ